MTAHASVNSSEVHVRWTDMCDDSKDQLENDTTPHRNVSEPTETTDSGSDSFPIAEDVPQRSPASYQATAQYVDIWNTVAFVAAAAAGTSHDRSTPMGSRGHATRQCKPCAFYHAQGCESGDACKFCHLCPPREVQRRKRLRRRVAREQVVRGERMSADRRERQSAIAAGTSFEVDGTLGPFGFNYAPPLPVYPVVTSAEQPEVRSVGGSTRGSPGGFSDKSDTDHLHHERRGQQKERQQVAVRRSVVLPVNLGKSRGSVVLPDNEPGSPEPFRCVTDFVPEGAMLAQTAALMRPSQEVRAYSSMQYMMVPMAVPFAMPHQHEQPQHQRKQAQRAQHEQQPWWRK